MSESQGQPKEGCLKKIIDFLNGLLPWLRFGFNIFFYIALIWVIIHAGNKLWINTLPKEPKAIKELIQVIKDNTKTVATQSHSEKKEEVEQEFKNASTSYYRNPIELPSLDSAKTTIETSRAEDVPESYTIQKDDFENALKAVALVARQEAVEDYHKSFSILVAILAVFGIGFPVIVALIQHSFNDRDLGKIEITAKNADEANNKAKEALRQMEAASSQANTAQNQANTAQNQAQLAVFQALMTSEKAKETKDKAEEALKQAKLTAKQANDAKDKAENASKQAEEISNQTQNIATTTKKNLEQINNLFKQNERINFEIHNEMFVIYDGLQFLFENRSPNMSYYCKGLRLYHKFTRYLIRNEYESLKDSPSLLTAFIAFFDQNKIQEIKQNKNNGLENNLIMLIDLLKITLNYIIQDLEKEDMKTEEVKKEIEDLQNDLITKKNELEMLYSKF